MGRVYCSNVLHQINQAKGNRIMDIKTINRKIGEIKRTSKTLQDKIHAVEIAAMRHAAEHGNHTPLTNLANAVSKGMRRKALILHIVSHSPLKWDEEKQAFAKKKGKAWQEENIGKAEEVPFWEFSEETMPTIDLDKLLVAEKLLELANKRIEKAQEEGWEIKGDKQAFVARMAEFSKLIAA